MINIIQIIIINITIQSNIIIYYVIINYYINYISIQIVMYNELLHYYIYYTDSNDYDNHNNSYT